MARIRGDAPIGAIKKALRHHVNRAIRRTRKELSISDSLDLHHWGMPFRSIATEFIDSLNVYGKGLLMKGNRFILWAFGVWHAKRAMIVPISREIHKTVFDIYPNHVGDVFRMSAGNGKPRVGLWTDAVDYDILRLELRNIGKAPRRVLKYDPFIQGMVRDAVWGAWLR